MKNQAMFSFQKTFYMAAGVFIAIVLTMSTFSLMILFWAFFAGVALSAFILRPGYEIPNLIYYEMEKEIKENYDMHEKLICNVCQQESCTRERSDAGVHNLLPWLNIKVNQKVDKSLTEFLELLLQRYVWKWYRDLSKDEAFIYELKMILRHCIAIFYQRFHKIDLAEVILNKLLHVAMVHVNVCLSAQKAGCNNQDEILMWYGENLHQALKSRRSELNYLRGLCDCVFPCVFPQSFIKSRVGKTFLRELLASNVILRGMDVIADPDKVNGLLLIYFDQSPSLQPDGPPSLMVPLLSQFTYKDFNDSKSVLFIDLPKIISEQDKLYQLMTFLKTVGAVHLLQFCLTVQDFNRRCLSQDYGNLERDQQLHNEACNIYNSYCCSTSPTFIHFDEDIVNELRAIAHGSSSDVNRLRTSAPLFRAYDHVYNLLEQIYCPLFYQSDIYYQMVCGDRLPAKHLRQKAGLGSSRNWEREGSRKGVKRKGKSSKKNELFPVETDLDPDTNLIEPEEKNSQLLLEDEMENDFLNNRNLSTWRISIPRLEPPQRDGDSSRLSAGERVHVFCIKVNRVDVEEGEPEPEQWQVLRRYNEFYVLESRLNEFHGSLFKASLPPKKIFMKTFEFLDSKRTEFERYLQGLLSQVALCRSELLHDFLAPEREGGASRFDSSKILPDVKLGRLIRRVPNKLIKEKGQHLDGFLQSFIQSCEAAKPKPGKYATATENPRVQMDLKLHSDMYPESDWQLDSFQFSQPQDGLAIEEHYIKTGVCDYLIFIVTRVFKANWWLHYTMVGFKTIFRNTLEAFTHKYLTAKIDRYRQEHHVVQLIHLLRDILFHDNDPPRTPEQKNERRTKTYEEWKAYIPSVLAVSIGEKKHDEGCKKLFQLLQQPKLNKQLSYLLLDTFLMELFPDLKISGNE